MCMGDVSMADELSQCISGLPDGCNYNPECVHIYLSVLSEDPTIKQG